MGGVFFGLTMEFVRKHPWLTVVDLILLTAIPVQEVLVPHLTGRVVDALERNREAFPLRMAQLIAAAVCVTVLGDLHDVHTANVRPRMESFVRARIVESVIQAYEGRYRDLNTGEVVARLVRVPGTVLRWFFDSKDYVLPYAISFFLSTAYFLRMDPLLGLALFGLALSVVVLLAQAPRACETPTRRRDSLMTEMCGAVEDLLTNLLSIYTSGTKRTEMARLGEVAAGYADAFRDTMMCSLRLKALALPLLVGFLVLFGHRVVTLARRGKVRASGFSTLFTIAMNFYKSVEWVVDITRDVVFDSGVIKNAEAEIEAADAAVQERRELPVGRPPAHGHAGVQDVWFTPAGRAAAVLRGASLVVREGERVAIVGDVGAGKSTLLRIIAGLTTPQRGDAFVAGRWLYEGVGSDAVAYVPQNAVLFDRTLLENLIYGSEDVGRAEVEAALAELGLQLGSLDARVGKNGGGLSGGQRQLVWCLRVLLRRPAVVLLDEPTASMDDRSRKVLMRMLERWARTVVMVTHDPVLAGFAGRRVRLEEGRLVVT